jgi:hypothetical protein
LKVRELERAMKCMSKRDGVRASKRVRLRVREVNLGRVDKIE